MLGNTMCEKPTESRVCDPREGAARLCTLLHRQPAGFNRHEIPPKEKPGPDLAAPLCFAIQQALTLNDIFNNRNNQTVKHHFKPDS